MMTETSFQLRAYGKTELALLYSPDTTPAAARRKLMRWISMQPVLTEKLLQSGFADHMRTLTPMQVEMIVEALGEP